MMPFPVSRIWSSGRSLARRLGGGSLWRRIALVLGGTLCVAAALAIYILLAGRLDVTGGRVVLTTLAAALCALAALVGASLLEHADHRRSVGVVTIMLSGIELVLLLVLIWTFSGSETLGHSIGVVSSLLVAFMHASLMLGRVRRDDTRVVRWLTATAIAFSMLPAAIVAGGLVFVSTSPLSDIWRLLGVLAVIGTLSTLLTPIARRLGQRPAGRSGAVDRQESPPAAPRGSEGRSHMLGLQGAGR